MHDETTHGIHFVGRFDFLVEQAFVMDPDVTVGKFIENAGKNMGAPVKLKGFLKFEVGEGIEKAANDFAAEVASFSQPKQ